MTDRMSPGDLSYVESFGPGYGYAPARASAAAGRDSRSASVQPARLHQRDLPLPHRPAPRSGSQPDGEYRRPFTLPPDWDFAGSTVIRFDGVDSCFAVFVNGTAVGHSQGSRLVREFEITHLVRPGNNVLAVRVHSARVRDGWCPWCSRCRAGPSG